MGKGSGNCDRPAVSLEAADDTEPKAILNMNVAEINTTLELQGAGGGWWTKDEEASFQKRKEGWVVDAYSDHICKAFEEYGLIHQQAGTSSYEYTYFPSLKAARQVVDDVSLEAGLNIASGLTRENFISYKIGDLPLRVRKCQGQWQVCNHLSALPQSLQKYFNTTKEFRAAWQSTSSAFAHYSTRKAAHQAVINWLSQTIAEGK
jgi:hypothetical protein